jgi:hypothetical protein
MLTLQTVEALRSELGRQALSEAVLLEPTTVRYPACLDRLRKRFPDELCRAALDIVLLRTKARLKFAKADQMLFDREGLEMATSEVVSNHRATRFKTFQTVADVCSGIGGDAISLARQVSQLHCVDTDPVRLAMAHANLAAYSLTAECHCVDALDMDYSGIQAVFVDPNRRAAVRRPLDPAEYQPAVPELLKHLKQYQPELIGIKIAPGVAHEDWRKFQTETEFVSLNGELKEAVLWFGAKSGAHTRATVLPGPHSLEGDLGPPAVGEPEAWIYDPDPAIVRAQQLGALAAIINGHLLDEQIGLLSGANLVNTPFSRAYPLEACLPYQPRKIADWLRAHGIGRLTFIQRGSGLETEQVSKQWKLKGDQHRVMILTKVASVVSCLICADAKL